MPLELVGEGRVTIPDSYSNPLSQEALVKLFAALHEAFEVAAEGGVGDAKWGDNDEADRISGLISNIWEKYQGAATLQQRREWAKASGRGGEN